MFDKGYCRFDWWKKINDCGAFFVTRAKVNMRLRATRHRPLRKRNGDGFKVLADDEVVLASKGNARLPIPPPGAVQNLPWVTGTRRPVGASSHSAARRVLLSLGQVHREGSSGGRGT